MDTWRCIANNPTPQVNAAKLRKKPWYRGGPLNVVIFGLALPLWIAALNVYALQKQGNDIETNGCVAWLFGMAAWYFTWVIMFNGVYGTVHPLSWAWIALALLALPGHLYLVRKFAMWVHYHLVSHPVEEEITAALNEDRPIDTQTVIDAIADFEDIADPSDVPPVYASENLRKRLDALRMRFESEAKLMKEVSDRERRQAKDRDRS